MDGRDELLGLHSEVAEAPLQPVLDNMARRLLAIAALFTPVFFLARNLPAMFGEVTSYLLIQTLVADIGIVLVLVAAWYRARLSALQIGSVMATVTALIGLVAVSRAGVYTVQVIWIFVSCLITAVFLGRRMALFSGIAMWLFAWGMGMFHARGQFSDLGAMLDLDSGVLGAGTGLGAGILAVVMVSDIVPRLLDAITDLLRDRARERERRWIAEEHSAETETRWLRYFDHAPVGITLLDDAGCVVGWNRNNERYLGMTREQMLGRSMEEYLRALDVDHPLLGKIEAVYHGIPFADFMFETPSELGICTLLMQASPLFDERGELMGAFMIGVDVTQLVARSLDDDTTAQHIKLASPDSLPALSGKLLGLRSALMTAGLSAEHLSGALAGEPGELGPLLERAQLLLTQQHEAATLADEAFQYISNKPKHSPVQEAGRLAQTATLILRARCEKAGIDLDLDDAFAEDALLNVQPVLLRQILINLISNAREAIERSDKAREQGIWVKVYAEAESVVFIVEDSAGGVMPVNPDVYFNPSFSTKGEREDSGKGLYVSRHTAERMGGSLTLEQGDQGLRFVLTLPRYFEADTETDTHVE